MSDTQTKLRRTSGLGEASPIGNDFEPPPRRPGQDFAFAVKLFGIAAVVFLLIWLMNRAVG